MFKEIPFFALVNLFKNVQIELRKLPIYLSLSSSLYVSYKYSVLRNISILSLF